MARDICWYCGGKLCWDSDFNYDEVSGEGDGIVTYLHCTNCGSSVEYSKKEGGSEERVIFIGIDPGSKGGISFIVVGEDVTVNSQIYSDDYMKHLFDWCKPSDVFCVVEQVHSMPRDGVKGAFAFGKNFGYILGVLESNRIPYQLVPANRWKKEFSVTSDKQTSIDCAKRLFPNVSLLPTKRCRKEHDGMAESLLIAEWGRRHYNGNSSKS